MERPSAPKRRPGGSVPQVLAAVALARDAEGAHGGQLQREFTPKTRREGVRGSASGDGDESRRGRVAAPAVRRRGARA